MSKKRNKYHLLLIEEKNNIDELPDTMIIDKRTTEDLLIIFYNRSVIEINN